MAARKSTPPTENPPEPNNAVLVKMQKTEQEFLNLSAQIVDVEKKLADLREARTAKMQTYLTLKELNSEMGGGS